MTGWFSRRSGSRVSIHNAVRLRVLWALSLSRNPMPPRITRKSDRRKVSDRTMVGTTQPLCLSALGTDRHRYESTMNLRKRKTHSVSFHHWGWTARPFPRGLTVEGEVFVLTSPFIERRYRNVAPTRLGAIDSDSVIGFHQSCDPGPQTLLQTTPVAPHVLRCVTCGFSAQGDRERYWIMAVSINLRSAKTALVYGLPTHRTPSTFLIDINGRNYIA
jgi:hypothetical protein